MDIPKSPVERARKRRRRLVVTGVGVAVVGAVLAAAGRLGRAAPSVERRALWIDTVVQGPMTRELQGVGELVPNDDASRWVAAGLGGGVERKFLEEGAHVTPETVLLTLTNADVEQASVAADLALEASEAAHASLKESLHSELLALRSAVAAIEAEEAQAAIQSDVDA